MLLEKLLKTVLREGTLNVIDTKGRTHSFVGSERPEVTIRLHRRALEYQIYLNPDLVLGEAYMNGTLTIEQGSLREFFEIIAKAAKYAPNDTLYALRDRIWKVLRVFHQRNPIGLSRRNVAHHYDLPGALYDLFLDSDKQYSCAYFENPSDDLETAQAAKKRHLAAKLLLEPGQNVLDIGSGWGGLALYLAKVSGANVTGLTLSQAQIDVARQRARDLPGVQFQLRDYRQQTGSFDRIVSVGMLEHVGVSNYQSYFETVGRLLADDGVALIHTIGRRAGPTSTSPWIRKYIFPGGYSPALSEVMDAVEKSGLWVTDIEALRLHYAYTLRAWHEKFQAHRAEIAALLDERFCRMWEYYLLISEASFLYGDLLVFQLQLAKSRDAVPITRGYIQDFEPLENAQPVSSKARRVA